MHGLGTFIFLPFRRVFRQESASRRNDWCGLTSDERVEDYVAFTAEKDGQIAGYTVLYVSGDHFEAQSSVVANREFPKVKGNYQNVSREWLNQRI